MSVYRELRRLKPDDNNAPLFEEARASANKSDWAGYQHAMSGINTELTDRPISMVYWTEVDSSTGKIASNQYGELMTPSIYGLKCNRKTLIHDLTFGKFQRLVTSFDFTWSSSSVNNCTRMIISSKL